MAPFGNQMELIEDDADEVIVLVPAPAVNLRWLYTRFTVGAGATVTGSSQRIQTLPDFFGLYAIATIGRQLLRSHVEQL